VRFRFAVETLSFVYTVPGHEGDDRHLPHSARARARRVRDATLERQRIELLEMVQNVFDPVERDTSQVTSHEIDELLLLSSGSAVSRPSSRARAARAPSSPSRPRSTTIPRTIHCSATTRHHRRA
jgi:excinuclease ABC subunit C